MLVSLHVTVEVGNVEKKGCAFLVAHYWELGRPDQAAQLPWYEFTEVVTTPSTGGTYIIQYTLRRVARWHWSSMDWYEDGACCFPAEIKGKHMVIESRRYGNQGKKQKIKWDIVDIQYQPIYKQSMH